MRCFLHPKSSNDGRLISDSQHQERGTRRASGPCTRLHYNLAVISITAPYKYYTAHKLGIGLKKRLEDVNVVILLLPKRHVRRVLELDVLRTRNAIHQRLHDEILSEIVLAVDDQSRSVYLAEAVDDRPVGREDSAKTSLGSIRREDA